MKLIYQIVFLFGVLCCLCGLAGYLMFQASEMLQSLGDKCADFETLLLKKGVIVEDGFVQADVQLDNVDRWLLYAEEEGVVYRHIYGVWGFKEIVVFHEGVGYSYMPTKYGGEVG